MSSPNGDVTFKPFYIVERLTEEVGIPITYAYDDLVFVEHSDILLQFDSADNETIRIYLHQNADPHTAEKIREQWTQAAGTHDIKLVFSGGFTMEQTHGKEEINIIFS